MNPISKWTARLAAQRARRRGAQRLTSEAFFGVPLYVQPGDPLEAIGAAAMRLRDPQQAQAFFDWFWDGKPSPETSADGIAFVRVSGALYRGLFYDDYQDIRDQVTECLADSNVRAIVLDIDSPGGRVAGCFDLSRWLFDQRGKGKPIWALVNDQATSAAYAIASATERVISVPTGLVGSVGAVVMHVDTSAAQERWGYRITEVASGERKTDLSPNKPLNAEGLERLERVVDNAAEAFFAEVNLYRPGLSVEALRGFEAGVFVGQEGLEAGLVDAIAMREAAIDLLRGVLAAAAADSAARSAGGSGEGAAASDSAPPAETTGAERSTAAETPAQGDTMATTQGGSAADGGGEQRRTERRTAEEKLAARARSITNTCALAGRPELAGEFIAQGLSLAQVQAKLLEQRANADSHEVDGHLSDPTRGSQSGAPKVVVPDTARVYQRWNSPTALMRHASES